MKRIIIVLFSFALTACAGKSLDFDTARQVKIGTTESELIVIMGKPTLTKTNNDQSSRLVFDQTWVWSNPYALSGARLISFGLKDGKVSQLPNLAAIE